MDDLNAEASNGTIDGVTGKYRQSDRQKHDERLIKFSCVKNFELLE